MAAAIATWTYGTSMQFGHEKGRRAHHGWHELSTSRAHRFDRAGIARRITRPLHHWDGENTDRGNVADGAA